MAAVQSRVESRQRCRVVLRPSVFAPRIARRMVYELGKTGQLPECLVDDAALVVGELVTDGIRQSRREIEVHVELDGDGMAVRVRNAHAHTLRPDREARIGGARASATVRRLADTWGCRRVDDGWEVWAILRAERLRLADAV